MKFKNKGRKIYKTKEKNYYGKSPVGKAFSVGLTVLHAADILEKEGISCRIVSMHTIKPIDKAAIKDAAENTGGIITIEEHNLSGGLGGAVSEVICDEGLSPKVFKRIALPDVNVALIGHQEWIREQYGMNAEGIAKQIKESLKK